MAKKKRKPKQDLASKMIKDRLEYLRGEIRAERMSYGEIAELQDLAEHIEPGDVELLEWAGVPENWTVSEFLKALPPPKKLGASEYTAVVDFIKTIADSDDEDMKLLETSLDEMFGYVVGVRERVREINRGQQPKFSLIGG
jgi:hypothetical protein